MNLEEAMEIVTEVRASRAGTGWSIAGSRDLDEYYDGHREVLDALETLADDLQRFREREPLVQAALRDAEGYSQFEDLHDLVTKALAFDLQPAKKEEREA